MSDAPEKRDLADTPAACPLCGQVHQRCRFARGTLYCIRPSCHNPHHRPPPAPFGALGGPFGLGPATPSGTRGVIVAAVDPGSPAARAGIASGDVITAVGGHTPA